ncbi:hypothetical protein Gotur_023885 [Gossypium turneri]
MGYNRYLGKCSIFDAELWGILDGLAFIHNMRRDGVLMQTDSLEVVQAIQDSSFSSSNSALIRRIHHLLLNARPWMIQHCPRVYNKIVDCLAKMAFDISQGLKIFEEISREVLALSPMSQASVSIA